MDPQPRHGEHDEQAWVKGFVGQLEDQRLHISDSQLWVAPALNQGDKRLLGGMNGVVVGERLHSHRRLLVPFGGQHCADCKDVAAHRPDRGGPGRRGKAEVQLSVRVPRREGPVHVPAADARSTSGFETRYGRGLSPSDFFGRGWFGIGWCLEKFFVRGNGRTAYEDGFGVARFCILVKLRCFATAFRREDASRLQRREGRLAF